MALLINILLGFYVFIALLMILVILMQRPKSEGLGAAFGGGVTENIFGAQTTNVLTKITSWLATLFFLLTFGLSILYAHKGNTQSELRRELLKDFPLATPTPSPAPGTTPAAATSASPAPGTTPTAAASTSPTPGTTPASAANTSPTPGTTALTATGASPTPGTSPSPSNTPLSTNPVTPTPSSASQEDSTASSATPLPHKRRRHR